jgi:hypothetical protein
MTISSLKLDIRRDGRAWSSEEIHERLAHIDDFKLEIHDGKLLFSDEARRKVLTMLLENVGLDAVVRLGDPMRWKEAIDARLAAESA